LRKDLGLDLRLTLAPKTGLRRGLLVQFKGSATQLGLTSTPLFNSMGRVNGLPAEKQRKLLMIIALLWCRSGDDVIFFEERIQKEDVR
jgi:hypothetical protein